MRENIEKLVKVEDKLKYLLISGHLEKDTFAYVELLESLNILSNGISSLVNKMSDLKYKGITDDKVYLCHIENIKASISHQRVLHRLEFKSIEEVLAEMKHRKYNGEFIEDVRGRKIDIDLREVCIK